MKKILLASAFSLAVSGVFAQGAAVQDKIKEAACKSFSEDVVKAEKNTADVKKGAKASTWIKLAEAYQEMAKNNCPNDSMSSFKSYNAYKKAEEIDKVAGGKSAKDISTALSTPIMYQILMMQGAANYNAKKNGDAYKLFSSASVVNPKDSTSAEYAGIAAQQGKDFEGAKKGFSDYIALGGKDPSVFYSLAMLYKNEKNTAKAVEILKKGIATNPRDKDLKSELVNTNLASGNTDAAIEDLKKIVDADPKNVQSMLNLAILLDNGGKKTEALTWYKKVLEVDPNNYDCNYNMGVYVFNQGVEMKKEVDKMDMKTYKEKGKEVEGRVCEKFNEVKPYFDKCKAIKSDDTSLNENIANLQGVLDQCNKTKK